MYKVFVVLCLNFLMIDLSYGGEFTTQVSGINKLFVVASDRPSRPELADITFVSLNNMPTNIGCRKDFFHVDNANTNITSVLLAAYMSSKSISLVVETDAAHLSSATCKVVEVKL